MRKMLYILIFLLAMYTVARGGMEVSGRGGTPGGNEIVILLASLPDNLDPARNSSYENALPFSGIYEGLIKLNPDSLAPEPCLADSWDVSEDGMRWTFHLKPGLLFSDGSACDAGAVKFSMSRLMVLREKEPYAAFVFNPVTSVEAEGKYTVSFILKYPYAPFLKNLALPFAAPVISPGAISRHGDEFWKHPSGTGPYMLKQFKHGEIVLEANPRYRGAPHYAGRIVVRAADSYSQTKELLDGKADIIFNPGREYLDRLQSHGMILVTAPGIDVSYIGFYTDRPPFNNKYLRKAVAYTLDREKIVAGVLKGEGIAAAGIVPPAVLNGKGTSLPRYGHDQARRILAREGYPAGIEVTLIAYQEARRYCPPGGKELAEEIKRQLEPAGIKVTIQSRPWNEHKEAISSKTGDFFLYGWTGDNGDADNFLYTLLASSQVNQGLNASGYRNGRVDVFLQTARRVADLKSRDFLYHEAQEIIIDEAPVTAINHSLVTIACRPAMQDVKLSGFGLIDLYKLKKE